MTHESGAAALLEELRRQYGRQAQASATMTELAGEEIDRELAVDYWSYNGADLENELWSRMPELESGLDIIPDDHWPGRILGRIKRLFMRTAMPVVRRSLEKQDRFNRRSRHMHFIQFLAFKEMRRRLGELSAENRELRGRLETHEAVLSLKGSPDHE